MAGLVPAPAGAAEPPPDPVECPAPLPGPRAVVQLAYMVLLRRCPDAAGAAAWEASLRDGLATETFARRIAATPEARGVVVGDAYRLVLDRPAAAGEKAFWAGWLRPDPRRVRRHDQLLAELAASAELYAEAGGTDAGFVQTIYERILGRSATDGDVSYWSGRLRALRGDRRALARMLLRLPEPLGATVIAAWTEMLGTGPDAAQRAWDVAVLRNDGDRLGLSARLVGSEAFDARAQARALVVPGRYVALGDSFVIGEGIQPWIDVPSPMPEPGEPESWRCGYSVAAYPEVARTSSELVPGTLDVAACTGSSLLDLYPYIDEDPEGDHGDSEDIHIAGQIAAIGEGEPPSLVTLTIGGNDIGFVPIVESCLQVQIQGEGQHSPYYSAEQCDHMLDVEAPAAIEDLREGLDDPRHPDGDGYQCSDPCSLTSAVEDVVAAAPEARVLVVGYPPLMPAVDTGCRGTAVIDGEPATGVEWSVAPADVRRGREVIADLNAALRDAAVVAGATYVDPGPRFAGHEVCSPDPWIHGLELDDGAFPLFSTFHPNRRGGVGLAAAVIDALED
ncbi:MAG TPA: SGNH/GDSL hydrolase family protein [Iamia sp.]